MKSDIINGKSTIIVDDHLLFTNGLTRILEDIGLKVHSTFSNAQEAIIYLKNQNVDIIFSDINMPIMDGIELTKTIRQLNNHKSVPVLVLSTEDRDILKKDASIAGANGWIVKPFSPTDLIEKVRTVIQ